MMQIFCWPKCNDEKFVKYQLLNWYLFLFVSSDVYMFILLKWQKFIWRIKQKLKFRQIVVPVVTFCREKIYSFKIESDGIKQMINEISYKWPAIYNHTFDFSQVFYQCAIKDKQWKVNYSQNCQFQNDQVLLEKTVSHFFVCYNIQHLQFNPTQPKCAKEISSIHYSSIHQFIYSFIHLFIYSESLYLGQSHMKSDQTSVLFSSHLTVPKSHVSHSLNLIGNYTE